MKSKFVELVGESYKVIRGFLSAEECDAYAARFRQDCTEEYETQDIAGNCKGSHQHPPAQLFLVNKNAELSEYIGEDLLPTYSYTRSYGPNGFLDPHTDRAACEISVTVHLDGDEDWDFQIVNVNDEIDTITLEKGDCIIFDGVNFVHNRVGEYTGEEYTQLFLHYVFAEGEYQAEIFDYKNTTKSIVKREDYISYFPEWLSEEECDYVVDYIKDAEGWEAAKIDGEEVPGSMNYRVCDSISASKYQVLDNYLFERVNKIINFYNSTHAHITLSSDEGYNILRYNPGGKYDVHTDHGPNHNRAATIIFNLNDDYEGGELSFFSYGKTYKLRKGDIIMFPSSFMFDHVIKPITSGVRYSMVTWVI